VCFENGTNNEEQSAHPHRRDEQRRLTTPRIDKEEYEYRCCHDLDYAINAGREERVGCARVTNLDYIRDLERQGNTLLTDVKICGA
jgi:hypothetical protein